jgi:hypothetical protein
MGFVLATHEPPYTGGAANTDAKFVNQQILTSVGPTSRVLDDLVSEVTKHIPCEEFERVL